MNTYIALILTAIVTISTIIYTYYSIQLWRTTRAAAEISRQAAFGNLWAELNRYLEMLREQGAPETAFLQKLSNLLLEFMITSLVTYASEEDQNFEEFHRKIFGSGGGKRGRRCEIPMGRTAGGAAEAPVVGY
jgi:hypothetical protein